MRSSSAALPALSLLFAASMPTTASAATKRIYIALDDHTDYMWTADEATYQQTFLDTLDYYLALSDSTAGNASAYQSRYNPDGSFWMWTYERNRSSAQFQKLIDRIKDGHFSMPLNPLVITYGGTPTEGVLRGMYYPGQIGRRYGVEFPIAIAMENQTMPYGLGALWAGAGAKYTWKGICGCVTQVTNAWDRAQDIYWWTGPDGSRILTKWNSMLVANTSMGGYAEARDPATTINYVDTDSSFAARYPYQVIGAFGKGWDDLETLTTDFITTAQSQTTSSRSIIVSNQLDFFQDFESTYGSSIPSVSVTYGNEWELYQASMAEVSASVKRALEQLRGAEALATLVSLAEPTFMTSRQNDRDQAWMSLGLYAEHDWTADGSISKSDRAAWERKMAGYVTSYVSSLTSDALATLGEQITTSGTNTRFFAFNPLSWTRDDVAAIAYSGSTPVHVMDVSTGQEVPSQLVTVNGTQYLEVLASQVPPVGYKVYEIQSGAGTNWSNAATVSSNVIENDYYKITVADRGAITSLIDKTRGNRELVKTVNSRAVNDLGSGSGTLSVESAGPVTVTLKATGSSPLAHTTRITLVRGSDRIDLRNEITQNFSSTTTWGFGFNLSTPDLRYEELGAVIRAKTTDQGGQYSTRQARYDWLTLNHFADLNDGAGSVGVTLSNADLQFMKLGSSTAGSLDTSSPYLAPLAGGQVDGSAYGISAQGGDSYFLQRFALRSHGAFDAVAAMKFSLEHQNPLLTGTVTGAGTAYPATSYSLLTLSDPNVLLWALKPADDGIDHGIIARVWNLGSSASSFTLSLADPLTAAQRTSHIETAIEDATVSSGSLSASIAGQQLLTFALHTAATDAADPGEGTPAPGDDDATAGDDDTTPGGDGVGDGGIGCQGRVHLPGAVWSRLSGGRGEPAGATLAVFGGAVLFMLLRRLR